MNSNRRGVRAATARVLVAVVVTALLGGFPAGTTQARVTLPPNASGPGVLMWNPQSLNLTVEAASSMVVEVSLQSPRGLSNLSIAPNAGLAELISASPSSVRELTAGTWLDIELAITIPERMPPGEYKGTIHAYDGPATTAKPLPVTIIVPRSGYIYWAGGGAGFAIGRATLAGTNVDHVFIPSAAGLNVPIGVAVDSSHIYWADVASGIIGQADVDGTNVNPSFVTLPDGWHPLAVAVDTQHVYWVARLFLGDESGWHSLGRIGRADLDGANVNHSLISGLIDPWYGIAVDGSHIYWPITAYDAIGRANLNGTGVNQSFITDVDVGDVAVDANYVYWTDSAGHAIGRANLNGTGVNQSFLGLTNSFDPVSVAVDSSHIYFATDPGPGRIGRANLNGTGVDEQFIQAEAGDLALTPE